MKKIFQRWRECRLWRSFSLRKRWFLVIVIVLSLILLYLFLSMLIVDQTELSLEKLRRSYRDEPICHEICAADREAAIATIIKGLEENPDSKKIWRLQVYLLDSDNELNFRISLVNILQEAFGADNPPDYIQEYMHNGEEPLIRAAILSSFSAQALSAAANPLDYYYEILRGGEDIAVKLAAARALSSAAGKENLFASEQLGYIKKMIFDPKNDQRLRQALILLLGDYYPVFPEETKDILVVFYKTDLSGDSISRAFAADILNRLGGEELAVPEISAEEWEEYYNN